MRLDDEIEDFYFVVCALKTGRYLGDAAGWWWIQNAGDSLVVRAQGFAGWIDEEDLGHGSAYFGFCSGVQGNWFEWGDR